MTSVKMLTLFVILVVGLLLVSPATAFDTTFGNIWIEFGGPLGVPPVVLQFSGSAPFPVPPSDCSPGTNYTTCAAALASPLGIDDACVNPETGISVPGKVIAELEFTIPLVPLDTKSRPDEPWVVGSSWAATCLTQSPTPTPTPGP